MFINSKITLIKIYLAIYDREYFYSLVELVLTIVCLLDENENKLKLMYFKYPEIYFILDESPENY